jgi:hypothetical protein
VLRMMNRLESPRTLLADPRWLIREFRSIVDALGCIADCIRQAARRALSAYWFRQCPTEGFDHLSAGTVSTNRGCRAASLQGFGLLRRSVTLGRY